MGLRNKGIRVILGPETYTAGTGECLGERRYRVSDRGLIKAGGGVSSGLSGVLRIFAAVDVGALTSLTTS